MTLILLTLFLGPFGAYRFYKKQYKLAILYIFTGGLLGIGYLYDLYLSFTEYFMTKDPTGENNTNEEFIKKTKRKALLATFICVILLASISLIAPATESSNDSYSSSDSWNESYTKCVRCGTSVQRKHSYSNLCGKCYKATH